MISRFRLTGLMVITMIFLFFGHGTSPVLGQYFGQNKVVYRKFDFKVLKTEHFDIYYYPEEQQAIDDVGRMAERWYARHSRMLGHELDGRQPLIIYASGPQFGETNIIPGMIGQGTGGVTEAIKRRIVLPFAGPLKETDHVIGHEMVHAFQYSIAGEKGGVSAIENPAIQRLPLWFIEGMAEFLSLGPEDPNTAMWMRDAAKSMKKLPTIRQLENQKFFPYRWGQALLAYISGRWGDQKIAELLNSAGKSGDIETAIKEVLQISPDSLSKQWHDDMHQAYDPLMETTKSPGDYGRQIIARKKGGGEMNVGPVLSPDGKNLIFYSEKSQFAIDLYLADAETGEIRRRIVRTEVNPHLSSLEFIYSAGAWDPEGKRVVFSAVVKDRPSLQILDIENDKTIREIDLKSLDEVFNPSWSPDGNYITFSALKGGFSDMFIYDLKNDSLRQITHDAYADLQPEWSPDGKRIVFVTDRFSTELSDLNPGNYQLALLDPESGVISSMEILPKGKMINPQWSPDGKAIYFISDYNGISNLYRYGLSDRSVTQLTDIYTGISGITGISPAISVASKSDRMVFSAYEDGKFDIYMIDSLETQTGKPSLTEIEESALTNPAMLPPVDQNGGELLALLDNPSFGLVSVDSFKVSDYHPKLSIDYVGQPYVAAGFDALGTQLGGGVALFWSDMLNEHNLETAFQLQTDGGFTDVGGLVGYQNNKRRWTWGGVIQQFPYTLVQYASGYGTVNGTRAYIQQEYSYRQTNREASGMAAYPFSRAARMEFSAGYRHVSFTQKIRTEAYDAGGNRILDQTDKPPSPSPVDIGTFSGAFVYDNALYGLMSPLLGQRFRLEAEPVSGSITFYTLLADYRRYEMPIRPFTLAFRALHYGRYGKDAEDYRLTPIFIGYQDLVRGYDAGSFSSADSVYDRLFGSKMAVANLELRFPLFGLTHLGKGYYGFLPIETGVFYDAGVAWSSGEKPSFLKGGNVRPVRSYGALIRTSILGYFVLEADYVKPVDRNDRGAYWQFNISAGF